MTDLNIFLQKEEEAFDYVYFSLLHYKIKGIGSSPLLLYIYYIMQSIIVTAKLMNQSYIILLVIETLVG